MIRVGVIGLGMMGRMHLGVYSRLPGVEVGAICSDGARSASGDFSGGWGNLSEGGREPLDMSRVRGTTQWHEVLEMTDLDVIDLCVPTPLHLELAIAALEAGKHVLCEKPFARTAAEAQVMADAAERAPGILMPAMCMRFWPEWAWLRDRLEEQRYGRLLAITLRRVGSMPPGWFRDGTMSGGALLDLHIHDSDFVCHLLGVPDAVHSRGLRGASGEIDHVSTHYIFEREGRPAVVIAEGCWTMAEGFEFTMRYTACFERATIDFDLGRTPALQVHHEGSTDAVDLTGDGYQEEIAYFIACIQNDAKPTIVTPRDAVRSLQVVEAERRSIETGAIVRLRAGSAT